MYKDINEIKSIKRPSVKLKSSLKTSHIELTSFPPQPTDSSNNPDRVNTRQRTTSTIRASAQPLEIQTIEENKTDKSLKQPLSKQSTIVSQPSKETEDGTYPSSSNIGSKSPSQESISKTFKREPGGSQIPVAGALFIATCLGSPVCFVAGLKLGMFAAVAGGIMGYTTGKMFA